MSPDESSPVDTIEYDREANEFRARFDSSAGSPSTTVVSVVAAITGDEFDQLDSLYEAVDPEALDRLLTDPADDQYEGDRSVRFTYHGFEIRIQSYGTVRVRPLASDGDDSDRGDRGVQF